MIKESLAQLQKVDLREVWKSEPSFNKGSPVDK